MLSVVNLQEAYAKALLVDRARAGGARRQAGDVLGGHEVLLDAYRTDVRPLCAKVRAERGAAEDPVAALRAGGYASARSPREAATSRWPGGGADDSRRPRSSHRAEDRWPAEQAPGERARAARPALEPARRRPRRGQLRRRQHVGQDARGRPRRAARSTCCGSRARAATWRRWTPRASRGLRLRGDPAALRARGDERRGDGRLPRPLPARAVDAALLDRDAAARLRPGGARRPHASRRDQRDRRRAPTARRSRASASATRPRGSPTSARASRSRARSARRSAPTTAGASRDPRQARPRHVGRHAPRRATARRSTRSTAPPTSSTSARNGEPAFGGAGNGGRSTTQRREALLARAAARPARGGVAASAPRSCRSTPRRRARVACAPSARPSSSTVGAPAPTTSCTPSACRCGCRSTPRATTPAPWRERIAERRRGLPRATTAPTSSASATRAPSPADPDPRVVLVQHVGLVAVGPNVKAARLSRDLYQRAIEVMAGADALGGFVSLTDAGELRRSSTGRSSSTSSRSRRRRGELAGQGRARHRRRRRHRPRDRRRARRRRRLRRSPSTSTATARARSVAGARRRAASAVDGDVTDEDVGRRRLRGGRRALRRRRHRRLQRRASPSSAPIEETTLERVEPQPRHARHAATSSSRARRSGSSSARAPAARSSSSPPRTRSWPGKNAAAYSSAKAAELHLARCLAEEGGPAGIRVNTVNPDAVLRARGSGTRRGARSAPPPTASRPTSSRSTTARARR